MKVRTIYGYMTQCFDLREKIKKQKEICHRYKIFNWVDEDETTLKIKKQIELDEAKLNKLLDVEV